MDLKGKTVNFLGDSITFGALASDPSLGYVELLRKELEIGKVVNSSIPGARIGEYVGEDPRNLNRPFCMTFEEMPNDADLVIVFGGTNDFGIGNAPLGTFESRDKKTFKGALDYLMSGLKEKYPGIPIVFMTPLKRRNMDIPNEFNGAVLKDYVDAIKERAAYYSFKVFDLFASDKIPGGEEGYKKLITEDGLHPNNEGHRVLADVVKEYLNKL